MRNPAAQHTVRPFHQRLPTTAGWPLKILHLLAPASFGGLERVVHALTIGQKKIGYDVSVTALLETGVSEPSLIGELHAAGVPVHSIEHPARAFPAQRRSLQAVCAETRPDVLHTHGYLADVLAASLGTKLGTKRVSTIHGFTGGGWKNRFYEWLQRRSYARFDAVVAVSRKLAHDLGSRSWSSGALRVLPNAWTGTHPMLARELARKALSLPSDRFNLVWLGRISHEKGPDVLIEALPALNDLPVHVTFIGDGLMRPNLQKRAAEIDVAHRISWLGEVAQASRLLPAFDLFIMSSRTEGTPISLFEAIDAGVPVVATSVGGVPDVVSPEQALLVPSENHAALARAIREVRNSPGEAAARASRAKVRLAAEFAAAPWIEAYDRIYRDVLTTRTKE